MSRLPTENSFLSYFALEMFKPIFLDDKYGEEPQFIITRRLVESEWQKTLVPNNFMRKQDSITAILYTFLVKKYGERAYDYVTQDIHNQTIKDAIKTWLEKPSDYKEIYKCNRDQYVGPVALPDSEPYSDFDFLHRFRSLISVELDYRTLSRILSPVPHYEFKNLRKNESDISDEKYCQFDIGDPKYNLFDNFCLELKNQIAHLYKYVELVWAPVGITEEKFLSDFSSEVIRTTKNLIQHYRFLTDEKDAETLIKCELLRLRLARCIDYMILRPTDRDDLIKFLSATAPSYGHKISILTSKTFSPEVVEIVGKLAPLRSSLSKSCGRTYYETQLFSAMAYRRRGEVSRALKEEIEAKRGSSLDRINRELLLKWSKGLEIHEINHEIGVIIHDKIKVAQRLTECGVAWLSNRRKGLEAKSKEQNELKREEKLLHLDLEILGRQEAALREKLENRWRLSASNSAAFMPQSDSPSRASAQSSPDRVSEADSRQGSPSNRSK